MKNMFVKYSCGLFLIMENYGGHERSHNFILSSQHNALSSQHLKFTTENVYNTILYVNNKTY